MPTRLPQQADTMTNNLFAELSRSTAENGQNCECFNELLARPGVRIERIVSTGQCSPSGFWYDQAEGEWVAVLSGEAGLRFADENTTRHLKTGDFVDIAPHRRHRVEWTAPDQPTVWLAVFYTA